MRQESDSEANIRNTLAEREAKKTPVTDQLQADLTTMKRFLYPLIDLAKKIDVDARSVNHILQHSIITAGQLNESAKPVQQDFQELVQPKLRKLIGLAQEVEELYNSLTYYQTELNARGKR